MFGRKSLGQKRIDSLIGAGTTVRGDVVFEGGLRVDGTVLGNVSSADGKSGTLVVSEHARIDGRVDVAHVVCNGTVNGPLTARDGLELQAKARVVGDVLYRSLEMQVGAYVQGRLEPVASEHGAVSVVELKRTGAGRAAGSN